MSTLVTSVMTSPALAPTGSAPAQPGAPREARPASLLLKPVLARSGVTSLEERRRARL